MIFVSLFSQVEDVDTSFCFHVETIIWADTNTGFAGGASFPNDADSTVIISWNEQPWLHFFQTLVWVHHGHGTFEIREQFGCLSICGISLLADACVSGAIKFVHASQFFFVPKFRFLSVIGIACTVSLEELPAPDVWKGSKSSLECNPHRADDQISEVRGCVLMVCHWYHSLCWPGPATSTVWTLNGRIWASSASGSSSMESRMNSARLMDVIKTGIKIGHSSLMPS